MTTASIIISSGEHAKATHDVWLGILICNRLREAGVPVFGSGIFPRIVGTIMQTALPDGTMIVEATW